MLHTKYVSFRPKCFKGDFQSFFHCNSMESLDSLDEASLNPACA